MTSTLTPIDPQRTIDDYYALAEQLGGRLLPTRPPLTDRQSTVFTEPRYADEIGLISAPSAAAARFELFPSSLSIVFAASWLAMLAKLASPCR